MWIIDGILAGLIAGVVMGVISQIGCWTGVLRAHLIVIDGEFVLRMFKLRSTTPAVYAAGILMHLFTSIAFGVVYVLITKFIGIDPATYWAVAVYVALLWLAMLYTALPAAGQGFRGKKIHRYVWLEQLILHCVFGFSFWWALGIY